MKKLFTVLSLILSFSLLTISCEKEKIVEANQLPSIGTTFLNEHFKGIQILSVTQEKEGLSSTEYTVLLDNGVEVTFDKNGNWKEVDAKVTNAIPTSFILPMIVDYVNTNYPTTAINGIDKEKNRFDVDLTNELDLVFDANGKFLRIDP